MTEERKPGWYWVKFREDLRSWSVGKISGQDCLIDGEPYRTDQIFIGPRIPTPDEATTLEYLIEQQGVKPLKSISQFAGVMGDDEP